MQPGAVWPPHKHEAAEQTWLVEHGRGRLLTSSYVSAVLSAGDVLITRAGETHGLEVLGDKPFVYLTVTTPPDDMTGFMTRRKRKRMPDRYFCARQFINCSWKGSESHPPLVKNFASAGATFEGLPPRSSFHAPE